MTTAEGETGAAQDALEEAKAAEQAAQDALDEAVAEVKPGNGPAGGWELGGWELVDVDRLVDELDLAPIEGETTSGDDAS